MAGVEKNILFGNGFKLQPSSAGDIAITNYLPTDISIISVTGSPAGVVSANPSSLSFDIASGNIYRKSSATDATGWVLLNTGAVPAAGAVGTILRSDGANWVATTSTYPNTNAISTLLYASAANVMSALATANNGMLVTSATGVPSILAGPGVTGKVLQSNAAAAPSFSTATYPSTAGTAGKALISDGTNIVLSTPTFPNASAAAGKFIQSDGTNWIASTPKLPTTSGTTSTLLRSNGTDWVNTSAFTIASTDIMTNTAQPGGGWFVQAATTNVTGDGTNYQVVFGATTWEQGSNFNTGTGTYTCPVTGIYSITGMLTLTGLSASFTSAELSIKSSAGTFTRQLFNPGIARDSSNNLSIVFSGLNYYTATSTIYITISVSGGTKTVGIKEESFGQYSYLNIMKVA